MKEQIDIIDIGMTFQMSLDAFLEESHVGYTKNEQSYQQALLKLEESKRVRSWQKKQQIAYEALDICEDCIEAYMMLGTYEDSIERNCERSYKIKLSGYDWVCLFRYGIWHLM